MRAKTTILILLALALTACQSHDDNTLQFEKQNRSVPNFSADSAYAQIVKQVDMGSRNPGSPAHRQAEKYLVNELQKSAGRRSVFVQRFKHVGYDGDSLSMANMIASFNSGSKDRIMLCAHWDSRPRADQDTTDVSSPILGADDGASGVAVLLEMARLFSQNQPPIGVDIIFLDGEDYGKESDLSQYFLGTRYWAEHPPVKNYAPRFGILLDMVGGNGAQFPKESYSMGYAPGLVNEIWSIAGQKGYDSLFVNQRGGRISDDHLIINRQSHIPTVDIVRYSVGPNGKVDFAPYWHTHRDNLSIIDKHTLKAVGSVLTELIYNRM